jgi:primosomal protein N''
MIENDTQLDRTQAAIQKLEKALAALKREVFTVNPTRYAVMAEPLVEQIQVMRQEVDDYIGLSLMPLHDAA